MFGKDKPMNSGSHGGVTLISKDTRVIGDLVFSGDLEVEGTVQGNILAEDNSDASVRILETGVVEGEIKAPAILINGTVKGDVYSSTSIELANKAIVNGNVYYLLIEMVKGAQVNGSLMFHDPSTQPEYLLSQNLSDSTDEAETTSEPILD